MEVEIENEKMKIKKEKKGVAGFFLDVPVLLFVLVAMTLFTGFFSQAYIRYQDESERDERDEMCLQIKRSLKGFSEILEESQGESQRGLFSAEKLDTLDNATLTSYLRVGEDHHYAVIIEDTEKEGKWIFGNEEIDTSDHQGISSYQTPVLLMAGAEQPHVGSLRVMVW